MKISIIIPCYNAAPFIKETIQSCLEQTFQNFELIIVDDGSTDSSVNIINELAARYAQIKLFTQRNLGSCSARNHGIEASTGELLFFLDADDLLMPYALERLFSEIQNYDACYADVYKMYEKGELVPCNKNYHPKIPFISIINEAPFCGSVLIRKSALKTLWDNKYDSIDEFYFFAKNASLGMKFRKVQDYVLKYRQHNGIHRKSNDEKVRNSLRQSLTSAYLELSDQHGSTGDEQYKKPYYNLVFLTLFYYWIKDKDFEKAKYLSKKIEVSLLFRSFFKLLSLGVLSLKIFSLSLMSLIYFRVYLRFKV